MGNAIFRLSIFIVAFKFAVAFVWFSQTALEYAFPTPNVNKVRQWMPAAEGVRVRIVNVERQTETFPVYDVEIVNDSSETLHYAGYSQDMICSFAFENKSKVQQISCSCGTGLESQELKPGEIVRHSLNLRGYSLKISGKVKLGFQYQIGNDSKIVTFWSNEVKLD